MTTKTLYTTPELPEHLVLPFEAYETVDPDDELGVALVRMLNANPSALKFRSLSDLGELPAEMKKLLLSDLEKALGLRKYRLPC